jgi:hypothetical protein
MKLHKQDSGRVQVNNNAFPTTKDMMQHYQAPQGQQSFDSPWHLQDPTQMQNHPHC